MSEVKRWKNRGVTVNISIEELADLVRKHFDIEENIHFLYGHQYTNIRNSPVSIEFTFREELDG